MALLTITNLTANPVRIEDLYVTIPGSGSVSTNRASSDLPRMASLQAAIAAGSVAASVSYTATEQASGLVASGEVATSPTGASDEIIVRVPLVAGVTGAADDVTAYALGALPATKLRVLDCYVMVSAAVAASKIQIRTVSGGAGTLLAECNTAATGRNGQTATVTATGAITNSSSVGLFVRRTDRAVAGEVFIVLRPET